MDEEHYSPFGRYGKDDEKKQTRLDAFLRFLGRGKEGDEDNPDSEEEKARKERQKKGKSSRWRRFFRSLLGGEQIADTKENDKDSHQSLLGPLIQFELIANDPHNSVNVSQERAAIADEDEEGDMASLENNDSIDNPPTVPPPLYLQGHHKPVSNNEIQSPNSKNVELAKSDEENGNPQQARSEPQEGGPVSQYMSSLDAAQSLPPEKHTKTHHEQKLSHHSPTGMLLGLDYLNYRGRKKLEKQVEQQKDQLAARQKHQAEVMKRQQHEIRQLALQQNKPEARSEPASQEQGLLVIDHSSDKKSFEKARQKPHTASIENVQAEPRHSHETQTARTASETTAAQHSAQPERAVINPEHSSSMPELASNERKIDTTKGPEDQQHELNKALLEQQSNFHEKRYERRHEVRDQARESGLTPVGAVLKQRNSELPSFTGTAEATSRATSNGTPQSKTMWTHTSNTKSRPVSSHSQRDILSQNRSAIVSGFTVGICMTLAYIILKLL